jgi:D-sedoheptulose 7-phosphate isomerase
LFQSYYTDYQAEFIQTIQNLDFKTIELIYQKIELAREEGKQVFVIGNGGSAASASHWVCDFGKGINVDRSKRLRILSLTDNQAFITALGNDVSYNDIFVEQLKNYLNPGDTVIGLSVSGASENVVRAFQYANDHGATVLSIIGNKKGIMKDYSDISLIIPSSNYGVVEDVHMYINHVISQYMRENNELEAKQN